MDKTLCEEIVNNYLPAIRSFIAQRLIDQYDHSQTQVAEKLGTTQAAVSQYLKSKRGTKTSSVLVKKTKLKDALEKAVKEIAESEAENIFSLKMCDLCYIIQDELLYGKQCGASSRFLIDTHI